jgi:hypothetical protein
MQITSFSNCASSNKALTILFWCIGLGFVAMLGFVILIATLVTVVAAIGSKPTSELETNPTTAPITQVSHPVDEMF